MDKRSGKGGGTPSPSRTGPGLMWEEQCRCAEVQSENVIGAPWQFAFHIRGWVHVSRRAVPLVATSKLSAYDRDRNTVRGVPQHGHGGAGEDVLHDPGHQLRRDGGAPQHRLLGPALQ